MRAVVGNRNVTLTADASTLLKLVSVKICWRVAERGFAFLK